MLDVIDFKNTIKSTKHKNWKHFNEFKTHQIYPQEKFQVWARSSWVACLASTQEQKNECKKNGTMVIISVDIVPIGFPESEFMYSIYFH